MPMFKQKSDEEKAAEAAADDAARAAAVEAKAAQDFAKSPQGRAREAFATGRRYFQMIGDVISADASATWEENVHREVEISQAHAIERVENEGWVLHDVGYVFQERGTDSKSKAIGSGDRTAVSGKVMGVYLFRRNESNRSPDTPS